MKWIDGNVQVDHPRQPWTGNEKVFSCSMLHDLKSHPRYRAAKYENDLEAAFDVVEALLTEEVLDAISDSVIENAPRDVRVVRPNPGFDEEGHDDAAGTQKGFTNALPVAFQAVLCEQLGAEPDDEIVQAARVGRTKLGLFMRFLCQPEFNGNVRPNDQYVVVDDVITTGGTFAALRSHIAKKGGKVTFFATLAHKSELEIAIASEEAKIQRLEREFGSELSSFWLEVVGHEIRCLTNAEAVALVEWRSSRCAGLRPKPSLQRLRARLNKAGSKGF